jgi:hypothetical protein
MFIPRMATAGGAWLAVRVVGFTFLLVLTMNGSAAVASPPQVRWICSTAGSLWEDRSAQVQGRDGIGDALDIDVGHRGQAIDRFGGCFNESGWDAMSPLSEAARRGISQSLFGADGCRFNICRMPVGASDYATDYYSLDDTPGDYEPRRRPHSLTGNPMFVGTADYQLKPLSPCINAAPLPADEIPADDYLGKMRPRGQNATIGAYQAPAAQP